MARPLSIVEGLKFIRQAFYNNDSLNYGLPNEFDIPFLAPYLNLKPDSNSKPNGVMKLANSFVDSNKQITSYQCKYGRCGNYPTSDNTCRRAKTGR